MVRQRGTVFMLDSIPNNLLGQFLKIFPENARPFLRSIRLALLVLPAGGLEVPIRRLGEAIFISLMSAVLGRASGARDRQRSETPSAQLTGAQAARGV